MILPDNVKVGGMTYKVIPDYLFKEVGRHRGQADHSLLEIRINPVDSCGNKRHNSTIEKTFIHELLHCIDEVYNSHSLDENSISNLSQGLYQVLSDNKILQEVS